MNTHNILKDQSKFIEIYRFDLFKQIQQNFFSQYLLKKTIFFNS